MEVGLIRLLGFLGALVFVLEGIMIPVSLAAHIILYIVFRMAAQYLNVQSLNRDTLLWFITASFATVVTYVVTRSTPMVLVLGVLGYSVPREQLAVLSMVWLVSALFYWNITEKMRRFTGKASFTVSAILYVAGSVAFTVYLGAPVLAAAFFTLAYAFYTSYIFKK